MLAAATLSLPLQAKGSHDYTALYAGDSSHAASTSGNAAVLVSENPVAIAIVSPANGATISVPGIVPLAVTAVPGAQTTIKRVTYSANGNPVGSSTEAPFGFSWGLFTPGSYTLTATSTTDTGQTATAAPITVTAVGTPGAGLVTYFHQDLSGNTIAATDGAGNLIYRENYRPYGERLVKDSAAQIGNVGGNRQWFHGKVEDTSTGLQYFGARYYDPVIGRFMGVDAAGVDPGNLHSGNRYAYGNNNPYRFKDPDGNSPLDVLFLGADLIKLGVAVYSGVGVGAAVVDVGMSMVGTLSPIPGTGQFLKGMRAVHAVEAARVAEKAAEGGKAVKAAKETGSYTIEFSNGMKYHGKGDVARMEKSIAEKEGEYGVKAVGKDWAPSPSKREAFKDEAKRIRADKGVENPSNYNKINSPGEKYLQQDGL